MSTMHPIININFNKKPSKPVIMRTLAKYLEQGGKCFTITWGENWIDLTYHDKYNKWYGEGWIKTVSGHEIAEELNAVRKEAEQFIKEHFHFIRLGHYNV